MITGEYMRKYKRFVQGLISEDAFRSYLILSLSKGDLIDLIVKGAISLKKAVSIGEPLKVNT
jgi:hypothetical protein